MNSRRSRFRAAGISLEAIDERHAPGIFEAMRDDEVCRYLAWEPPKSLDETLALVREANDAMARGQAIVYGQVWNATGRAIGSTRLLDVRPADRQVEIGSTFLGRDYWRTPANTESKYLFLRHCFESLGCVRVALKTDDATPLTGGDRTAGRRPRGRPAPAHADQGLSARHRVLLDPRRRVARGGKRAWRQGWPVIEARHRFPVAPRTSGGIEERHGSPGAPRALGGLEERPSCGRGVSP